MLKLLRLSLMRAKDELRYERALSVALRKGIVREDICFSTDFLDLLI